MITTIFKFLENKNKLSNYNRPIAELVSVIEKMRKEV